MRTLPIVMVLLLSACVVDATENEPDPFPQVTCSEDTDCGVSPCSFAVCIHGACAYTPRPNTCGEACDGSGHVCSRWGVCGIDRGPDACGD